jgi:serine/threonine protein kinase
MAATSSPQDDLDLGATLTGFASGQVVFGRYKLDRILGRGGMGVVWLAHDQEMGEDIALKFLPEVVRLDALGLQELKAETRKSRKLTHRNIVRVHDFVSDAHSAGISMEWVDGSTLSTLRLGKPAMVFEPEELKPWIKQACEALEFAHNVAKLIHRDLKPANIMLNAGGEVKVADFGISSSLTESASRVSVRASASGTLAYMSPQQALGARPTIADDVYSLGATIYELISGKPPFFRGDLYAQVRDVVPPSMTERRAECEVAGGEIPEQWEKTVAACLEKDPAKRPCCAMEVAWRLGLVKDFQPPAVTATATAKPAIVRVSTPGQKRPAPWLLPAGIAALFLLAGLVWYFTRPHPAPVIVYTSTPAPSAAPAPVPTAPAIVAQSPAPAPAAPSAAPSIASVPSVVSIASPAVTPAAPAVDKKLVGTWQSTGSSVSTRKHWELQANGKYLLSVGGTITDSGTMSAANGQIHATSKTNRQSLDVTYDFDGANITTQGDDPFDDTEWRKVAASSSSSSPSSSNQDSNSNSDSGDDGGVKSRAIDALRSHFGF